MTVYNSVILLETGVPLANTTPRPPVTSSRYRHFINISLLRWASDVDNPATFRIFVYKNRFLYAWLSSTNSRSTPSCSMFHYVPLHSAPAGIKYGRFAGEDVYTTKESERLVRLPMFYNLDMEDVKYVTDTIDQFDGF